MQQVEGDYQKINRSHPMAYLPQPQLLNKNPNSTLDITYGILYSSIPTIFSFELSRLPALICIYFLGNYGETQQFVEMGLGILMAYILVYNIIVTVNLGFAAACVNISNAQVIGLLYQKTLAVNCFYCIVITPLLYLSDVILLWFFPGTNPQMEQKICKEVGVIIWGLVPSFYLSCFHDTTRNYLQAQGILYQPLIIQSISVIIQILFTLLFVKQKSLGIMGVIWGKNIADTIYAICLYVYIVICQPTKQSWIQWNMLSATKNWKIFLKFVMLFVVTKYIQAFAFEIMCLIACKFVQLPAIAAQIYIANGIVLIRLAYHGIADAVNHSIYKSLIQRKQQLAIKKFKIGLLITFVFSGLVTYQLIANKQTMLNLFTNNPLVVLELQKIYTIIILLVFIQPIHAIISCFLSSMRLNVIITFIDIISFYFVSISVGICLCYFWELGLIGIWIGWLTGLILSILIMSFILFKTNYNNQSDEMIEQNSELQQIVVRTVRQSTVEFLIPPSPSLSGFSGREFGSQRLSQNIPSL